MPPIITSIVLAYAIRRRSTKKKAKNPIVLPVAPKKEGMSSKMLLLRLGTIEPIPAAKKPESAARNSKFLSDIVISLSIVIYLSWCSKHFVDGNTGNISCQRRGVSQKRLSPSTA